MLTVDKSLSYLNEMLHHPSVFKLDPIKQKYISKSTLNSQVRLDISALCLPYTLFHYARLQAKIHRNREFVLFLVFKLLERGIYISARNVAMVETDPTPQSPDDMSALARTGDQKHIVHCDVIAFHAKKRHVYAIVVCDNVKHMQQCRAHAQRVATNIRRINPHFSTVFPYVLTVYDFDDTGSMRLCAVHCKKHGNPYRTHKPAKPRPHVAALAK
jgi:hypothetical protein